MNAGWDTEILAIELQTLIDGPPRAPTLPLSRDQNGTTLYVRGRDVEERESAMIELDVVEVMDTGQRTCSEKAKDDFLVCLTNWRKA